MSATRTFGGTRSYGKEGTDPLSSIEGACGTRLRLNRA